MNETTTETGGNGRNTAGAPLLFQQPAYLTGVRHAMVSSLRPPNLRRSMPMEAREGHKGHRPKLPYPCSAIDLNASSLYVFKAARQARRTRLRSGHPLNDPAPGRSGSQSAGACAARLLGPPKRQTVTEGPRCLPRVGCGQARRASDGGTRAPVPRCCWSFPGVTKDHRSFQRSS